MNNFISQLFSQHVSFDGLGWVIYLLAFFGGIITSISPCSIGLLPVVVGFIIGRDNEKKDFRSVIQIFFFILGLALMLTLVGVFCALTGKIFGSQSGPYWGLIMASLIMIFGLNLLEIIEIPMPVFVKSLPQNRNNNLVLYPLLIGFLFAFATTPCSTPILAGILAYASVKGNIISAALMLFLFSIGQGSILVIAALFTSLFKKILQLNAVSGYLIKASGVILVLASIYIYLKIFEVV
ncbi:MAG: cytochrome c biogenesis protein CcdA [Candidatus Gastranaerophilales bacterium]|nr:cytochrome c biogenesis protein CcdA [Candidatus Gastranaerophilales bacterium]